jgi:hypothetical protein
VNVIFTNNDEIMYVSTRRQSIKHIIACQQVSKSETMISIFNINSKKEIKKISLFIYARATHSMQLDFTHFNSGTGGSSAEREIV